MELSVSTAADSTTSISVEDSVFAQPFNEALVHQAVVAYLAGARQGSKAHKNRSAVRGGGAKPWRQKGTGRARSGTSRSPIWRGGGVTFASTPRNFSQKLNRKMYKGAMRAILSELFRQERAVCIEKLDIPEAKTKSVVKALQDLNLPHSAILIITESPTDNLILGARNLPNVEVAAAHQVDPISLLNHDNIIITQAGLMALEARLK